MQNARLISPASELDEDEIHGSRWFNRHSDHSIDELRSDYNAKPNYSLAFYCHDPKRSDRVGSRSINEQISHMIDSLPALLGAIDACSDLHRPVISDNIQKRLFVDDHATISLRVALLDSNQPTAMLGGESFEKRTPRRGTNSFRDHCVGKCIERARPQSTPLFHKAS